MTTRPRIAITMGDPAGIGPEVVGKTLSLPRIRRLARFTLIGDLRHYLKCTKKKAKPSYPFIDLANIPSNIKMSKISKPAGLAAYQYLEEAVALLKAKEVDAVVTAPVCKEAICLNKIPFQGHTEFFAQQFNVRKVGMLFVADQMRLIIATRHLPLRKVPAAISMNKVYETIKMTSDGLFAMFNIKDPVIGVCGLNPHAGEGGRLGLEEIHEIIPAIRKCKRKKINVHGPYPSDTLFQPGWEKKFDAVVAMYHDQGLIPIKTIALHKLVNVTLALPFIRTSTAHGTAFDIAGKDCANPLSMQEAVKLAVDLVKAQ